MFLTNLFFIKNFHHRNHFWVSLDACFKAAQNEVLWKVVRFPCEQLVLRL